MKTRGFTLMEVLIYLALFSIIIGGAMVAVYHIIDGNASLRAKAILQEEGGFIMAKLDWALSGAISDTIIESPAVGGGSDALIVKKLPGNNIKARADLNNNNIRFDSGSGFFELNSERINVPFLEFSQPRLGEIKVVFTLSAISDQGRNFSQTFETTKYLKK